MLLGTDDVEGLSVGKGMVGADVVGLSLGLEVMGAG